jgi:hypothetical protein
MATSTTCFSRSVLSRSHSQSSTSRGGEAPSVGRAVEKASSASFHSSSVRCQTTASHSSVTVSPFSPRSSVAR